MSWTRYLSNPLKKSHWTYSQAKEAFETDMWPRLRAKAPEGSKKLAWFAYLKVLHQKGLITLAESKDWVA